MSDVTELIELPPAETALEVFSKPLRQHGKRRSTDRNEKRRRPRLSSAGGRLTASTKRPSTVPLWRPW